ncbi:hypothetical protein [Paenibacillus sp. NEAU-GSW1]|nr:hypothetical protein [Paenibacillus sp. NEAU-GSW1]
MNAHLSWVNEESGEDIPQPIKLHFEAEAQAIQEARAVGGLQI